MISTTPSIFTFLVMWLMVRPVDGESLRVRHIRQGLWQRSPLFFSVVVYFDGLESIVW